MGDMKIVKSLEKSGLLILLIKGESEAIQNEAKEQKIDFLASYLSTLDKLGNLLAGKKLRAVDGVV